MKANQHPYDRFYDSLVPALSSKVEEFELLGYGRADVERLWAYLTKKKWKKPEVNVKTYQLVSDVLTVKPGEYMSFETVEAYRSPNWFEEVNEEELNELLRPGRKR
ncbi:post-transcriptional regulator [Rossellomorea aquimaris]|jgi:Post-transcriptional regulator|uniref:Competence protein ComN n=1 Tax=Rossellomorea aquimaris TaxID=189382 RepID=A0A1J6WFP2_9BACI|nr:post-transcriptional regulator [Rossellomorea aquimaris]OIU70696.1 competence protein ComN [Rossellomorea aquimaris]